MFTLYPQLPATHTTSAHKLTQVSHVSIISPVPMWQTQIPPVCSLNRPMFPLYPQPPVTNTTSACMFTQVSHVFITSPTPVTNTTSVSMLTQVSHVSIISLAPWDKHNFRLYAHLSVPCFHYIPSLLWQTQLPTVCSPKCHMFPLHPQPPVTSTTSAYMLT